MFNDILEHDNKRCENCWWSSGHKEIKTPPGEVYCSYHKHSQANYMWCEKHKDRYTRE
jgi:hypothetical protein